MLRFYNDFNRGGIVLDRFLQGYSSHLFSLGLMKLRIMILRLKTIAMQTNEIIKDGSIHLLYKYFYASRYSILF